jgi:hypothetical protein
LPHGIVRARIVIPRLGDQADDDERRIVGRIGERLVRKPLSLVTSVSISWTTRGVPEFILRVWT